MKALYESLCNSLTYPYAGHNLQVIMLGIMQVSMQVIMQVTMQVIMKVTMQVIMKVFIQDSQSIRNIYLQNQNLIKSLLDEITAG